MNFLETKQVLSVIGIGSLIGIAILGIQLEWWKVTSFLEYGPYYIIIGIFGLIAYGFKDNIVNLLHKTDNSKPSEPQRVKARLALRMGSPDFVDPKYIWHYHSRDRINFPVFMRQAKKKIRMSGLTFSLLTLQHETLLHELASAGKKLTLLILDPSSEQAKKETSQYASSNDLIDQINSSLTRLCELKERYPKNITIKKYTRLHGSSITVLDDSIIKVEEHVTESGPNDRENLVIFKKVSKKQYLDRRKEFDDLEESSAEHMCQPA